MSSASLAPSPLRPAAKAWPDGAVGAELATATRHLAWLSAGLGLSFAVPYLFADRLDLGKDLYYGLYGAAVLTLCAAWMRDTHQSLAALVSRRWRWALLLGGLAAAVSVIVVSRTEDATAHPGGIEFIGAIIWRGLFYGAIDGLLLTAFPILVVFAAFSGSRLRRRWPGIVAIGVMALAASVLMTATYHLGYSDFRSEKVRKPMAGDLIWAAPVLATLNPIGAPIAHAGLHVAAVTHSYDTELFLPPH